jgi:asparagine synthase (glutamine-hydrolysing)
MCGITGFWQPPGEAADTLGATVRRMAGALQHRGPDDEGTWQQEDEGVALGFRRLAIIDVSPLGHQPMTSAEGRYTIVFNGEIYNFLDLKAELVSAGHQFRGGSDTEVILAGFTAWGVDATLRRIAGMFAIGVWDAIERRLTLARDRIGKKPLYYGRANGAWVFGSELKAIRRYPGFTPEIDRDALTQFLRFSYVPAPRSIYAGISKLPPGHYVTLTHGGADAKPVCYWDASAVARNGQKNTAHLSDADAIDELDRLLRDAVSRRMIADVPLGAFLSGGLDSSTVVALMQAQSVTPVKTFTIGFDVSGYDEAQAAKAVAAHLCTDHTELYVTPEETLGVIPLLPTMYDEPFADSSQIPTYLVSKLARTRVTVSLSGDGGDELFAGYNRYFWGPGIWSRMKHVPPPARRALAYAVQSTPPAWIDRAYGVMGAALPISWGVNRPGDKLHKLAGVASAPDQMELYLRLVSAWHAPSQLVIGGHEPSLDDTRPLPEGFRERMMYRDLVTYLPEDVLVKVDRASMAVSLEARAPLLDHRLVEWAWRLPTGQRVRDGRGKWLLRQVLYRYVPRDLVDRPKMGFGVPIDHWLRGPLRGWAEDLLSERALESGGLLRPGPIRKVWRQHLAGHRNEHTRLWPVLMFQAWRQAWLS